MILQRKAAGFARKTFNEVVRCEDSDMMISAPDIIEGAELYDSVCPVSKLTGKRVNPLTLIGLISGAKADVLNALLQDLPVLRSDSRLSDNDRVDFLVSRLSSGSPAEDAIMAEKFMNDLEALGLSQKQIDTVQNNSIISFDSIDSSDSSKTE